MEDELQALIAAQREAGKLEAQLPGWKDNLVLLHGTLASVSKKRAAAPSRIPPPPPGVVGATAIAATLMGMGTQAQVMVDATDASSWKDEADWVEFEMDGNHFRGVLWMMPMHRGDEVRVVAEKIGENRYFAYAVQRDSDAVVAIYPNAVMGTKARGRFERKGTLGFFVFVELTMAVFLGINFIRGEGSIGDFAIMLGGALFAGALVMMFFHFLGKWKFRNSIEDELAERIFHAFGWPDPTNFNLRKVSRWPNRARPSEDLPLSDPYWYFNLCYFRYELAQQA
ncbi:MAG: hypothetical protein GAK33_01122 [Burkholderia lata]|uniref:Uncharacterized protein n=1 Tax=Burkholderia lata (strain ATCC 17760 / DSM 23089 / LMG 22485 / NCIMB 9086 / R18194 / 383) TaxID=482957 RepID=A0A833V3R1_BURL3|nr:putative type VI secretion system effector [Burkholderia lata]KAF1040122.1 MAG: hypothetical protein GAK33_01122 [Burkholderia lata]